MNNDLDYNAIKTAIENEVCPEHNLHPVVEVTAEGTTVTTACCEKFRNSTRERAIEIIREEGRKFILSSFRDSFRK